MGPMQAVCVEGVMHLPIAYSSGSRARDQFYFSKVNADLVFSHLSFQEFKNTLSR